MGLALMLTLWVASARADAEVERVSFTPRADGLGYVVRIHTTEAVAAYSEPVRAADDRIELTLFNTRLAASFRKDSPQGPVRSYALEQRGRHLHLRFVLSDPAVAPAVYRDRGTTDLLLSLSRGGKEVAGTAPVELAADARERWRLDTIVIDPGHG
ncbi:MAG: hypothetical protein D6746_05065, partial [Bacteroidetes bacterium]